MSKTLIVLNPHAAGGRAGKIWEKLESELWQLLGELVIAVTQHPEEVARHIEAAYSAGLTRVISIGGDGTNHSLVNALVKHNLQYPDLPQMVYGMLPVGTGKDWARSMGIPFDHQKAAQWIATAQPHEVDVGQLTIDNKPKYFLNIASAGMSGDVAERVNHAGTRRPWTFLQATIQSLLRYRPQSIRIKLDGQLWYEGASFVVAVANGSTFGHGMLVAPHAKIDDGLLDVVLMKDMALVRALLALRLLYDGSHLSHPRVDYQQAKQVEIVGLDEALGLELDGEAAQGRKLRFAVLKGALRLLT